MKRRAATSAQGPELEPAAEARLSPEHWESYLGEKLSRRVRVVYGRSRSTPLQARRPRSGATRDGEPIDWLVRMHAMFAAAPPPVRNPPQPAPTTTSDRVKPTGPPGQGKPPTTPPGHG